MVHAMKTALSELLGDLLSSLVFLVLFSLFDSLLVATLVAIGVAIAQLVYARMKGKPISAMQWLVLGLTLVLSSLTLITQDSRFVQLKPSIGHFAVGMVMLKPGWQLSYLPTLVKQELPERTLLRWGYAWAGLMFAMGLANIAVAQFCSLDTWGMFVGGLVFGKLALFFAQYLWLRAAVRAQRLVRSSQQQSV
jgi:intracellular septation protein A